AHQQAASEAVAHQQAATEAATREQSLSRTQLADDRAEAIAAVYGAAKGAASTAANWLSTALQHLDAAATANRAAAQDTATAAKTAKTDQQRAAAAGSAATVIDRGDKITAALAALGVGQCDVRSFTRVTPQIK